MTCRDICIVHGLNAVLAPLFKFFDVVHHQRVLLSQAQGLPILGYLLKKAILCDPVTGNTITILISNLCGKISNGRNGK